MIFDVADEFIQEMETQLGVTFPAAFHEAMTRENGGTVDEWELYPVADTSTRERMKHTRHDIIHETEEAQDWDGFPAGAIAVAGDGFGDQAIVIIDTDTGTVGEEVSAWSHETGETTLLAPTWESWFAMRDGRNSAEVPRQTASHF